MQRLIFVVITFALVTTCFSGTPPKGEKSSLKRTGHPGLDGAGETEPADGAAYDRAIAPYVAKARASYPCRKETVFSRTTSEIHVFGLDSAVAER